MSRRAVRYVEKVRHRRTLPCFADPLLMLSQTLLLSMIKAKSPILPDIVLPRRTPLQYRSAKPQPPRIKARLRQQVDRTVVASAGTSRLYGNVEDRMMQRRKGRVSRRLSVGIATRRAASVVGIEEGGAGSRWVPGRFDDFFRVFGVYQFVYLYPCVCYRWRCVE